MAEQEFIKAGFTVVGTETSENKLLSFLKENYPNIIKDTEINLEELKTVLGLPIDEKVNGYGLNFVGRNFARAKYAQKTEKELRLNTSFSKKIDTTQNLVLKGDNLDSLKILKNHYSGKIKCIYIDPPYNTKSEEFVYPDKFDKEEAEVLGLANLSENDFARMDFSFKTKQSHNGWLAFMNPRLLLARDLLSNDGVVFISIDDNEQANLKLLCDDVFGEENFVGTTVRASNSTKNNSNYISITHDYCIVYAKSIEFLNKNWEVKKRNVDDFQKIANRLLNKGLSYDEISNELRELVKYPKYYDFDHYYYCDEKGVFRTDNSGGVENGNLTSEIIHPITNKPCSKPKKGWRYKDETIKEMIKNNEFYFGETEKTIPLPKRYLNDYLMTVPTGITFFDTQIDSNFFKEINLTFDFPKPYNYLVHLLSMNTFPNDIILDFFAGSGTTGHAVMQLNAEDGGNRKFILCQIDEPIKEDKPAYKYCLDNNLPPVISSITLERLKRAGEKIAKDIEEANSKSGMFEEDKKQVPDIGFKVFDSVEAPKLKVDEMGQISITENDNDALSRIYNMIFTVGLDEPTQAPVEVVKDCIYKIGNHNYITNSEKITSDDYSNAIKNGKVFIDGWTASLNGTLQNYKEDVKIVF